MAVVNRRVSDLSGAEAADAEFGRMVVRKHPSIEGSVELDFLPAEIESMKAAEVVQIDITMPDGTKREATLTLPEFNKLASGGQNMATVLASGRGTRGRRAQAL